MLLKNTTICLLERVKRRTFALFFMVLDLRLVKIGCRETINFFYAYAPCAQLRVSSGTKKASEGEAF